MENPHFSRNGSIGFIGLGLLGQALALRLIESGYRVCAWNREAHRYPPLREAGAVIAGSPREVALACDVVCLCVLDAVAVESVVFGQDGVLSSRGRTKLIIDFSTVQPDDTQSFARRAAEASCAWIDSPVSGGPEAGIRGELTLMVGGSPDDVQAAMPLLSCLGSRITHLGSVGKGQEMKVLNQALVGMTFVMLAEALALARRLGLPAEEVPQCLQGGFADSTAMQRAWPRMAAQAFDPPTGRAGQMLKDLKNVDEVRASLGIELPMIETALNQYRRYVDSAGPGAETVSISRLYAAAEGKED